MRTDLFTNPKKALFFAGAIIFGVIMTVDSHSGDTAFESTPDDSEPLREHPRYGTQITLSPRLHFCGTETSGTEGGYLEGAVIAAMRLAKTLTESA